MSDAPDLVVVNTAGGPILQTETQAAARIAQERGDWIESLQSGFSEEIAHLRAAMERNTCPAKHVNQRAWLDVLLDKRRTAQGDLDRIAHGVCGGGKRRARIERAYHKRIGRLA